MLVSQCVDLMNLMPVQMHACVQFAPMFTTFPTGMTFAYIVAKLSVQGCTTDVLLTSFTSTQIILHKHSEQCYVSSVRVLTLNLF
jgi:hypothetical protein